MSSLWWRGDVKLLPEDVTFDILLWLPVLSLLRFKSVCKSWCVLIDSSYFIKQHIHRHHHYNHQTSMKDRKLILFPPSESDDPHPNTFLVTSVHNFEVPTVKLELEFPMIGYLDYEPGIMNIATFDGIICLNYREVNNDDCDSTPSKYVVSLFNPATKRSRVLPKSSLLPIAPPNNDDFELGCQTMSVSIGFGFDVKTNDYKVVRLFSFNCGFTYNLRGEYFEKQVEVYTLSSDSWRVIDCVVPIDMVNTSHTFRPFQNGTCYSWWGNVRSRSVILCFDFSSEMFRAVSIPDAIDERNNEMKQLAIINDNIACISCNDLSHLEIWMLNDYGSSINEYWAMHIKVVDFCQIKYIPSTPSKLWFSMDGKYVFFEGSDDLFGFDYVCRYDLVTKAIKKHHVQQFFEILKDNSSLCKILGTGYGWCLATEFKESLVSVKGGNR